MFPVLERGLYSPFLIGVYIEIYIGLVLVGPLRDYEN